MNDPYFSIIIPSYNRAFIIEQTIQSVLNQSFPNFEIILIDDGSTDNTTEVVSSIKDRRLIYIFQENAERSAARNNGIQNAKGKYICFLDSDDWYEPNHLAVLYEAILNEKEPIGMFFTNCKYFQKGQFRNPVTPILTNSKIDYLLDNAVIPARVSVHNEIFRSFLFREDIIIVEDQVLWVMIATKYPIFHINECTVVYHLHDDNSIDIKNNCFKPRLEGLKKLFNERIVRNVISKGKKKELISHCYYGIAKYQAFKRNYIKMLVYIALSIYFNPNDTRNKEKIYMIFFPSRINTFY